MIREQTERSYQLSDSERGEVLYINEVSDKKQTFSPLKDTYVYKGRNYVLASEPKCTLIHRGKYEYTKEYVTPFYLGKYFKVTNRQDGRIHFPYTAKPSEHLALIVATLNEKIEGYHFLVGDVAEEDEKLVEYDNIDIVSALKKVAKYFDTAFEIEESVEGYRIHLRKVEYYKSNPLRVAYGKGKGLLPNIQKNYVDQLAVTRLYVQGGERNINRESYGSSRLKLPRNGFTIAFDGQRFTGEEGFVSSRAKQYRVDHKGEYIENVHLQRLGERARIEDSFLCEEVYPSHTGRVSSVVVVDQKKCLFDFIDSSNEVDYNRYLTDESVRIIFQSGYYSGQEFTLSKYDHSKKRFALVAREEDRGKEFKLKAGDKYKLFGIALPQSYIEEAEEELLKKAVRRLDELETPLVSLKGQIDPLWLLANPEKAEKIRVGAYLVFEDFEEQGVNLKVQIKSIKRSLQEPNAITISLDNAREEKSLFDRIQRSLDDVRREGKRKTPSVGEVVDLLGRDLRTDAVFLDSLRPPVSLIAGELQSDEAFLSKVKGRDGQDGARGQDGRNGRDGRDGTSVALSDVLTNLRGDSAFLASLLRGVKNDGAFVSSLAEGIRRDTSFINAVKPPVSLVAEAVNTEDFQKSISSKLYQKGGIARQVTERLSSDENFQSKIRGQDGRDAEEVRANLLINSTLNDDKGLSPYNGSVAINVSEQVLTATMNRYAILLFSMTEEIEEGAWYTLSFDVRSDTANALLDYNFFVSSIGKGNIGFSWSNRRFLTSEWQRVSITMQIPRSDKGSFGVGCYGQATSLQIRKPKLEKGKTATAWIANGRSVSVAEVLQSLKADPSFLSSLEIDPTRLVIQPSEDVKNGSSGSLFCTTPYTNDFFTASSSAGGWVDGVSPRASSLVSLADSYEAYGGFCSSQSLTYQEALLKLSQECKGLMKTCDGLTKKCKALEEEIILLKRRH